MNFFIRTIRSQSRVSYTSDSRYVKHIITVNSAKVGKITEIITPKLHEIYR